jgi:TolA-binding protein
VISSTWREVFKLFLMLFAIASSDFVNAQTLASRADTSTAGGQSASEVLKKLDQLVEQNRQLEHQNRELMDQIVSYRQVLAQQAGYESEAADKVRKVTPLKGSGAVDDSQRNEQPKSVVATSSSQEEPYKWGAYTPNLGYKVANTDHGDL